MQIRVERYCVEGVDRVIETITIVILIMLTGISYFIGWNNGVKYTDELYKKHIKELEGINKKHLDNVKKIVYERGVQVGKSSEVRKILTDELIQKNRLH